MSTSEQWMQQVFAYQPVRIRADRWVPNEYTFVYTLPDKHSGTPMKFLCNVTPTHEYPLLSPLSHSNLTNAILNAHVHREYIMPDGMYGPGEAYIERFLPTSTRHMNYRGIRFSQVTLLNTGELVWIPRSK